MSEWAEQVVRFHEIKFQTDLKNMPRDIEKMALAVLIFSEGFGTLYIVCICIACLLNISESL